MHLELTEKSKYFEQKPRIKEIVFAQVIYNLLALVRLFV
jgi:hypothetical protein